MGPHGIDFFLVRPRRKKFRVGFVAKRDGDGHLFLGVHLGCLGLVVLVREILGQLLLGSWLAVSVVWVPILWMVLIFGPPDYWDADDLALEN